MARPWKHAATLGTRYEKIPFPTIRLRYGALELWEAAGRPEGQAEEHWRQAENELLLYIAQMAAAAAPASIPVIAEIS